MVALLTIAGISAFAVLGFLGYPTDSAVLYTVFHPAWLLFLWFCSLVIIVQLSIFRHEALSLRKWQTLAVTVACIAVVAAAYASPIALSDLLNRIAALLDAVGLSVERGRLLWNLVNFGVIILYVVDRLLLWIRGKRAEYVGALMDLEAKITGREGRSRSGTTTWEFVSQDLFAGAALCLTLGVVFQASVLDLLARPFANMTVDSCAVSWASGACTVGGVKNPPTLSTIDWSLAFFAIAASILLLGTMLLSACAA